MKILLDVCTPVQVRHALPGHDVWTAVKMGWGELENGALLGAADSAGFELFIICDKNMRHQQNLAGRRLASQADGNRELEQNISAEPGSASYS